LNSSLYNNKLQTTQPDPIAKPNIIENTWITCYLRVGSLTQPTTSSTWMDWVTGGSSQKLTHT